mmetsp:Transcript_24044/g.36382  ORF Transcript_24044/g.36382 Transcript_24044/m.36382 type:complete len:140 (+) Transcript_24044:1183-1602(+)
MSTPTALGQTNSSEANTVPIVTPFPKWASGMTETKSTTMGVSASNLICCSACGSISCRREYKWMGTPSVGMMRGREGVDDESFLMVDLLRSRGAFLAIDAEDLKNVAIIIEKKKTAKGFIFESSSFGSRGLCNLICKRC